MKIRSYSELVQLETIEERFQYLSLRGVVAEETFGNERYLNQRFYHSAEWKDVRNYVIVRDECRDLAVPGFELYTTPYIHHMNPMVPDDIIRGGDNILNPEYLITVCHDTHNAIHYGDESQLPRPYVERSPGDTTLWPSKR